MSTVQTRSQRDMKTAAVLVFDVPKEKLDDYERLAKSFPMLVQTAGLAQALAFHQSKKDEKAHGLLLEHVAAILEEKDAVTAACGYGVMEYRNATRRVLHAWTFFKRFAVARGKGEK